MRPTPGSAAPCGEGIVKGTDFAVLDGERLKTVIGFLDQIPAAI